ncbi:cytochrome c [Cereibacter ovatus]|uniref:Cytochrome c n=1 Tax=Cereibacter ovatus TaxID=439529 RepID=A0A285CJM0_9RHOB|nr:c-type cytochrome [Cereibacter ovatus]SNX67545.1 cytochrome c [Cereibacter ovatus]
MRLTDIRAATVRVAAAGNDLAPAPAFASEGDPQTGENVFRKCSVCHQIGEGAAHKTGPILTGIVGRPAASLEGGDYSPGPTGAAETGLVRDHVTLADFLANPRKAMPGIRTPDELADLIACLGSVSASPVQEAGDPAMSAEVEGVKTMARNGVFHLDRVLRGRSYFGLTAPRASLTRRFAAP